MASHADCTAATTTGVKYEEFGAIRANAISGTFPSHLGGVPAGRQD